MSSVALWLMVVYLLLAFGVRVAVQLRRTGSTGISSLRQAPPIELVGGTVFAVAVLLGGINPVLAVLDVVEPAEALDRAFAHVPGLILCGVGIVGTFAAQMAMGTSWRIGVDPEEKTELVTNGVFRLSRNPIYSFMVVAWAGFALLVPTWVALVAGLLLIVGLEIQVRLVEEPHLVRTQGERYLTWAARVGRFVPGVGKLARGASVLLAPVTGVAILLSLLSAPSAGAVVVRPGDILVADIDAFDNHGGVIRIDPRTGAQARVASNPQRGPDHFEDPYGLAVGARALYVLDLTGFSHQIRGSGGVIRVDRSSGRQTVLASNQRPGPGFFDSPGDVALGFAGYPFVTDTQASSPRPPGLIKVRGRSGRQRLISRGGGFAAPAGAARDPRGRILVADPAAFASGAVFAVNARSGAKLVVSSNTVGSGFPLADPVDVAVARDGILYVLDDGPPSVLRVDPATGNRALVTVGGEIGGGAVQGIAIEPSGSLLVSSRTASGDRVVRINAVSGTQSVLAGGGLLRGVGQIAVAPPRCGGRFAIREGTAGGEIIRGSPFADVIVGLGGSDRLLGRGGGDRLCGGPGDDTLSGGRGRDRLFGGPGADALRGGPGLDRERQ